MGPPSSDSHDREHVPGCLLWQVLGYLDGGLVPKLLIGSASRVRLEPSCAPSKLRNVGRRSWAVIGNSKVRERSHTALRGKGHAPRQHRASHACRGVRTWVTWCGLGTAELRASAGVWKGNSSGAWPWWSLTRLNSAQQSGSCLARLALSTPTAAMAEPCRMPSLAAPPPGSMGEHPVIAITPR